jgi:hypothetical protein
LDIPFNLNPWDLGGENRKWQHFMAQPSLRIWTREVFRGHFFGIHGHWAQFNAGNIPVSDYMRAHHFEGTLAGGGVSWGYRWNFGRHWGLETELGVGYAYLDYDIYKCGDCGDFVKHETKNYFGPTKLAVNLVYAFGGGMPGYKGGRMVTEGTEADKFESVLGNFTPTFVVPLPEHSKERMDSIRADLEFVFGIAKLDPYYKNNASELRKLNGVVDDIRRSRHTAITGVNVTGFASPEGAEQYNMTLSERRAMAVRDYLCASTGLPSQMCETNGEGERPDGLRAMVQVEYTVEPFSLDEAKRVLHTRPQSLSVEEMFRVANTYNPESQEYREVFEIAAATFPHDDVANLNAAAVELLHGDADAAAYYLERVKSQSPAWWDNVGIVFYLRGDMERAEVAFSNAGTTGLDNAAVLKRLSQGE